ncbi:6358_t:CDS:2 [Funneliformis mosseae]|uniref:6358_t:CDS:1 n=1 Tax=Funneliformis mosseae TaxID=27381 RepID=A0A9N8WMA8_FUNMO|nr:6358_t:CDS:2 [Funneliformis mosseae]
MFLSSSNCIRTSYSTSNNYSSSLNLNNHFSSPSNSLANNYLVIAVTPITLQTTTPTRQSEELIKRYLNIKILRNNSHELLRIPSVDRPISPDESNATAARAEMKT